MDNFNNFNNNDPGYQRPRKKVTKETLRKRQFGALVVIAFIVLLIVILVAKSCSKDSVKKGGDSTSTTTTTTTTSLTDFIESPTTTTEATTIPSPTNDPDSGFVFEGNKTTAYFSVGSQGGYAAIITGYPEGSTYINEVWTSSNTSIATVNEKGWVTPVSAGECYITVSLNNNPTKQAMIRVIISSSAVTPQS